MVKKALQVVVLVLSVFAFYLVHETVYVSLWANNFHFQYYWQPMTPYGVYNTILDFSSMMVVAVMAGALFERLGRRGYSLRFAAIASITFLALVYHWTQPVLRFLSYTHPGVRPNYDIFATSTWVNQWYVSGEELVALAAASCVLFCAELMRRVLASAGDNQEEDPLFGSTANNSI